MLTSLLKSTRALPTLVWFAPQRMQLSSGRILTLNNLENIPGAKKKRKRVGRGRGSGLGKMSGRGHQKARSVPRGYEGGQTTMVKRLPKIGFHNSSSRYIEPVSLSTIQDMITMGRLRPKPNDFTTIRDLYVEPPHHKHPESSLLSPLPASSHLAASLSLLYSHHHHLQLTKTWCQQVCLRNNQ